MSAKHIKFLLVFFVTLFSINSYSLQLGKVIFQSNQNSPLDVSIEVNLSSEDKIDKLKPSIATKENYKSQGIERTKIHNDISLSLISKRPNKPVLRLTSKIPVTEPFLDLLIQIESPSGKILKEYTVLLDPPLSVIPSKKIQEKKVIKKELSLKKIPEKIKKKVEKKTKTKVTKKIVIAKPGKTLFQIARENSIAGVTTEQIVIGIYQVNPNSFDGNLNGLIRGKTLKLPLNNYYKKLSHLDARKILKQENINWKKSSRPKKISNKKNNVSKEKKVFDELSRLKNELENANKKLLEKDQALKAMERISKPIIIPNEVEIKAEKIISDSIREIKEAPVDIPIMDSSNSFLSSVTDQNNDIIQEVIIDDEENSSSIKTIFVLLLIFLLTLLLGLLFIIKKRKKETNADHFSSLSETHENKGHRTNEVVTETNLAQSGMDQSNEFHEADFPNNQSSLDDAGSFNKDEFNPDSYKDDESR